MSFGAPQFVGNSNLVPETAELVCGQHLLYTCDEGCALEGDPRACERTRWTAYRQAIRRARQLARRRAQHPVVLPEPGGQSSGGTVTTTPTPLACLPVICGVLPRQQGATWNETRVCVFLRLPWSLTRRSCSATERSCSLLLPPAVER